MVGTRPLYLTKFSYTRLNSIETTVLMSVEETMEAREKAGQIRYRAPGT